MERSSVQKFHPQEQSQQRYVSPTFDVARKVLQPRNETKAVPRCFHQPVPSHHSQDRQQCTFRNVMRHRYCRTSAEIGRGMGVCHQVLELTKNEVSERGGGGRPCHVPHPPCTDVDNKGTSNVHGFIQMQNTKCNTRQVGVISHQQPYTCREMREARTTAAHTPTCVHACK